MIDLDPSSFAEMDPHEFAVLVKGLSDKEIRELMAGDLRQPTLEAIFERFPAQFRPEKAQGVDARVDFRVTGGPDDSSDTCDVAVADGTCHVVKDPEGEPTTSLMLGPAEFDRLTTGGGNPVMTVLTGKIKLKGHPTTALAFQNWFDIPKA